MGKKLKSDKELELSICESVIKSLSDKDLTDAKNFVNLMFKQRKTQKLYNTYIEGVECALKNTGTDRMYVNYNLDVAVTGRQSNSGMNIKRKGGKESKLGVSLHTLPREDIDYNIRKYVIAYEDGWDFITADMKAMELRILAHVAHEKNMIAAFNSGVDLHSYSAGLAFNKPPDKVTKEERQMAKEVSFLTVYGGTAYTLANKRNISEEKAQIIIDKWMNAYPGVPRYMETIREFIKQHKYAITLFGRKRNLLNIDSPVKSIANEAFRQGLNFTVQSPASDIVSCGFIGISNEIKKRKLKGKLAGMIHDSIEFCCPKEETEETVSIITDELVNSKYLIDNFGIRLNVPMEIDIHVGTSFGG